jgi:AcrR family transcriptional regulator
MNVNSTVRVRRSQEERTARSDQLMTQAAIALLIERGVQGTTLAAIGERAGYSRGLVTHRFGSKAGLLAQVHDSIAASWIQRVQAEVGKAVGTTALERVVDALYRFIAEAPDAMRAMCILRFATIDPASEYRSNVAKVHRAQRRDVQRWIEAGQVAGNIPRSVKSDLAAELFCAAGDGVVYRWLVNPDLPMEALHKELGVGIARSLAAVMPKRAPVRRVPIPSGKRGRGSRASAKSPKART